MNEQSAKSESNRRESGMFKTEKSAKYALLVLMAFFALSVALFYFHAMYDQVCLGLGMELICYWAYLNPWILQEKYSLFLFLDTSKMVYNRFLVVGFVIFFGSAAVIIFDRFG